MSDDRPRRPAHTPGARRLAGAGCAFVEGAIPDAETLVEGNGPWAQQMLQRKDFSGYATDEEELTELKRISDLWWASYERGQATARN